MKTQFELIIISPEEDILGEIEILSRLFIAGLQSYHVRKPYWNIDEVQQYLEAIPKEFHNKIILHSHFQLAHTFAVKGIHLNEENKKLIPELNGHNIISASFHSLRDLEESQFAYEYVFLSPIFNSLSKAGYNAGFSLETLTADLKELKHHNPSLPKIIALGGVSAANIQSVKQTGFDGTALLGAIWQSKFPVDAFLEIKAAIS